MKSKQVFQEFLNFYFDTLIHFYYFKKKKRLLRQEATPPFLVNFAPRLKLVVNLGAKTNLLKHLVQLHQHTMIHQ